MMGFVPFFIVDGGLQYGDWEEQPTGMEAVFGMQDGHRVVEVRIDLETSHLKRLPGETFGWQQLYVDDDDGSLAFFCL